MMKSSNLMIRTVLTSLLLSHGWSASAFVEPRQQAARSGSANVVSLSAMSRRDILSEGVGGLWVAVLASTVLPWESANAAPRPTYLTEPTEEFKANEVKAMEFRKAQFAIKQKFLQVLERFTSRSKPTEEDLVADLNALQDLVIETRGLPLGIKKDDMYKIIRSVKAKGFWPTNVEIAYQSLKREIAYQQSPNTDKDETNPL